MRLAPAFFLKMGLHQELPVYKIKLRFAGGDFSVYERIQQG